MGSSKITGNTPIGRVLVRIRAKMEKNTLFGKNLVRIRTKIEKITLFDGVWLNIEKKHPFLVGLLLE